MKRLILPIVIVSCVVAASVFAGPVKRKPVAKKKPTESWYKALIKGRPVGYVHYVVTYEEYEGRRIKRETAEAHMSSGGPVKTIMRQDVRCELDGRLIKQKWLYEFEGMPGAAQQTLEYTATVANGVLKATVTGRGVRKEKEIQLPKGVKVYPGVDECLLKRHGIGPGKVAEFHVFAFQTMQLEKATVKKVERVKHVHEGKKVDAFRAVIERTDRAGFDQIIIMTVSYEMLKTALGDMEFVLSNKKDALANVPPPIEPPEPIEDDDEMEF